MRRYLLTDLDPYWVRWDGREPGAEFGPADALQFDCPDGGCGGRHTVPVTPDLAGAVRPSPQQNGAVWSRSGGDGFSTLTLNPSIRCSGWCRWHGYIEEGRVTFCSDSQSGPEGS